jgi:ribosomal subunit interface protein
MMQIPVQVTFRDMPVSDAIEATCWQEAEKLERYFDRITSCRIVISEPHRRHRKGNLFAITVDLTVPGEEIVVNREPAEHHACEDVQVALRETFDIARRQLQDYVRRIDGRVKEHHGQETAQVIKLFPSEGYGFIRTIDGRELYFHEHSVLHRAFNRLGIGSEVGFTEEMGVRGPQATTVHVLSTVQ